MSWKKYFQKYKTTNNISNLHTNDKHVSVTNGRYGDTYLTDVYAGHPQRLQRYSEYDIMDQDTEINAALDTISDFSTRKDDSDDNLFNISYTGDPSSTEMNIIKNVLNQWIRINKFNQRIWRIFRSTLKYGDQFFIRDPETLEWLWVPQYNVDRVIVNTDEGKKPLYYEIKDLDLNLQSLVASMPFGYGSNIQGNGTNTLSRLPNMNKANYNQGSVISKNRFSTEHDAAKIDAKHIIHISLSEGLDMNWPFGTSILEPLFKVFKQKELLEDAIMIYRIQRAPERRIFYIDTGNMPTHLAQSYLERVKMEMQQRRIPSRTGNGTSITDASYNPMSMLEDYFFAVSENSRGSRVETLPAGENLGQIDDLKYFNNKLVRALRIPSSYLPTGPDDGTAVFNDGRTGTAYIQEFRFAMYCQRLQTIISPIFDTEFKLFMKQRGYNIDSSLFELQFVTPQYFSEYARLEKYSAALNIYSQLKDVPYLSKRFLLEHFLMLSKNDIGRNEDLWQEENPNIQENINTSGNTDNYSGGSFGSDPDLQSIGLHQENENFEDLGNEQGTPETESESPISGNETNVPEQPNEEL